MSTKTTFKRIALVAVAALGFGTLTVAPATAGVITTVTAITAGTSSPARLGVAATNTLTITSSAALVSGNEVAVYAKVTSAPAGSAFATQQYAGASFVDGVQASGTPNKAVLTITEGTNVSTTDGGNFGTAVPATSDSSTVSALWTAGSTYGTTIPAKVSLTADVAGTYTVQVGVSAASATAAGAAYAAGDRTTTITFVVAGAPASIALASVAGSIIGGGTYGRVISVSLKDAAGNATVLGANEAITVSDNITSVITNGLGAYESGGANAAAVTTLSSSMISGGLYYIAVSARAAVSTAETGTLTVTGSGLLPATLTTNISVASVKGTTPTATALALGAAETCLVTTNTPRLSANYGTNCSSFAMESTVAGGAAAFNEAVDVTLPSGIRYSTYYTVPAEASTAAADAITETEFTVSATTALTDTAVLTVAIPASTPVSKTVSFQAPIATTATIVNPTQNIVSALAATNAITVKLVDQYAEAMPFQAVTVAVTGRNATASAKSLGVTDANGLLTYSHTDAGTSGSSDSVVLTAGGVAATARVITYGTVAVSTITITGGNTTASVANATTSTFAIEADDTPESALQTGTVTVKDVNGSLLAGVAVTFTVTGEGVSAAILSTKKVVYTGSAGTAATSVYAWKAGTYTVTATAGDKSTTASYTFGNSRAADARVLSATSADGLVTAKVVDRFGNPVSGVTVYASRTSGTGYFGTGVSKTSTTTGLDGTAEFTVVGTAEVKVSTLSYDAVPGTNAPGQTCALAGNITCAVGATAAKAFTATTAGTATIAEENMGSSLAPAGVSAVTVSVNNNAAADNAQAATDAAAEATDAANAATDAANAAAEAADAATAAAQDAADAVAALSTQVSEMVNALKKQITALTNLVIKIQKKVKA
jgi:hypothetical protein